MWPSEQQEKERFALEWLRLADPFRAALAITGDANAGRALLISSKWVHDPFVLAKRQGLIDERGEESFLPTKSDIARKVLEVHEQALDKETKLKALRLYSEVLGFITKPGDSGKGVASFNVSLTPTDAKL